MNQMKVLVIMPTRNGAETIEDVIYSIMHQSVDADLVVINDGSTDNTLKIVREVRPFFLGELNIINIKDQGHRSYARVPALFNLGYKRYISHRNRYVMYSGDDTLYPPDYLDKVISFMLEHDLAISGGVTFEKAIMPSGSGRVLDLYLCRDFLPFPESIVWESGMIYEAYKRNLKVAPAPVHFEHLRDYTSWSAWTFGHSAYCLGYPLIYSLGRSVWDAMKRYLSPLASFSMLFGHLEYMLRRPKKHYLAPFVHDLKIRNMLEKIKKVLP